jgi:hypothetical protein
MLIIAAGLFGWLPGPGGIPLLLAGLALLARNHDWAKRLQDNVLARSKNIVDVFFPDKTIIKAGYDIISIAVLGLVVVYIDNVTHKLARGAMLAAGILSVTIFLINRRRIHRTVNLLKRNT